MSELDFLDPFLKLGLPDFLHGFIERNTIDFLRPCIGRKLPGYAVATFSVLNGGGQYETCSTKELNLVPVSPLHVNAFEETDMTADIASLHGSPERPPAEHRVYKNATGSWDFYYVQDGNLHAGWDDYGINCVDNVRARCGIADPTKTSLAFYPGWQTRPGEWSSAYYRLMRYIQGRRCILTLYADATAVSPASKTSYTGRCWVSSVKPEEGRMVFTISYDLEPPDDYK